MKYLANSFFYLFWLGMLGLPSFTAFSMSAISQSSCDAGESLAGVLDQLKSDGARIIYTSELVKQWMRTDASLEYGDGTATERQLKSMLKPFALDIQIGSSNSWSVVSSRGFSEGKLHFIRGVSVYSDSEKRLPGVKVLIEGTGISTITGPDGCFVLPVFATGEYTLRFMAEGYESKSMPLYVYERNVTWVESHLERERLEELEVVGRRHGLPYLPIRRANPAYPRKAKAEGVTGYAVLEFTITPDGNIADPEIVEAYPKGYFEENSLDAVKRLRFRRYGENEAAPPPIYNVRYSFKYVYRVGL